MARIWKSPFARLAAYYVLVVIAVTLLVSALPAIREVFSLEHLGALSGAAGALPGRVARMEGEGGTPGGVASLAQVGLALLAMVGVLVLMAPVVWVYMLTKQRRGYDQSVVQTMILLPVTVAGVMMVVQSSRDALALAFALAAIVAAVRFRNTLKDTKDTVYIFLAIGVGLAAGSNALVLGALMSVVFNLVVLILWKFNVGNIYADQLGRAPALRPVEALLGPGKGAEPLAVGDPELLAALTPDELDEVADRAARLQAYIAARGGDEKKKRFNGVLLVHATQLEPAQRAAEATLDDHAKRWKLAEILRAAGGRATLEYLIRLKDDSLASTLLDAVKTRGAPHVIAAEFKSLRGLKPKES